MNGVVCGGAGETGTTGLLRTEAYREPENPNDNKKLLIKHTE